MDALSNSSSTTSCGSCATGQPKSPKSPPGGFDLFGKRKQLVKVQILEKEIGMLQEEIKFVEGLQAASRCCREIDDFVGAKSDPLVLINVETHESKVQWKRLCLPWICCFSSCIADSKTPTCSPPTKYCSHLCSCWNEITCQSGCKCLRCSCQDSGCRCFSLSLSKCNNVKLCSNCSGACSKPCCL
ncbi:hypothetical protein K2173_024612 [Erythroxylum novogranatense]|uniref:Uncharacterized protein n=1 Tax=Erythroxylum novogranatense TaxID=1862640 RepID=A0AAV8SVK5_9ROSI|nr:hypothetical protein K2173_024612 [Erythroxylum novogranatense]